MISCKKFSQGCGTYGKLEMISDSITKNGHEVKKACREVNADIQISRLFLIQEMDRSCLGQEQENALNVGDRQIIRSQSVSSILSNLQGYLKSIRSAASSSLLC
jgi:hypothetical protein